MQLKIVLHKINILLNDYIEFKHVLLRLPASGVAKSTIQEGTQYSIYQKRDQIWSLKLRNSFQYRKG